MEHDANHLVQLPWLSHPEIPFPARAGKSRRRRRLLESSVENVELPQNPHDIVVEPSIHEPGSEATLEAEAPTPMRTSSNIAASTPRASPAPKSSTLYQPPARSETPSTQDVPSEAATSTSSTTPSSVHPLSASTATSVTPTTSSKPALPRAAVPILPLIPALPKTSPKESKIGSKGDTVNKDGKEHATEAVARPGETISTDAKDVADAAPQKEKSEPAPAPAPTKVAPKSWANLFAKPSATAPTSATGGRLETDGGAAEGPHTSTTLSHFSKANAGSVAEVLQSYRVGNVDNLAFLEPRGLINTGNMCYMNSVSVYT